MGLAKCSLSAVPVSRAESAGPWFAVHKGPPGALGAYAEMQVKWRRIVLDEAHSIKDRSTSTAKAVFALNSKYKLCLTGTPLQNRVGAPSTMSI